MVNFHNKICIFISFSQTIEKQEDIFVPLHFPISTPFEVSEDIMDYIIYDAS